MSRDGAVVLVEEAAGQRIEHRTVRGRHAGQFRCESAGLPTSPISRMAAIAATIFTNTDSPTASPARCAGHQASSPSRRIHRVLQITANVQTLSKG
jgi:hypothetical protein